MTTEKIENLGHIMQWSINMYRHYKKPHRRKIAPTLFADDMARALELNRRYNNLATWFANGKDDRGRPVSLYHEMERDRIHIALENIAKKYNWKFNTSDGGLSCCFTVEMFYKGRSMGTQDFYLPRIF